MEKRNYRKVFGIPDGVLDLVERFIQVCTQLLEVGSLVVFTLEPFEPRHLSSDLVEGIGRVFL